jgi:broad specificity phosphatase PhoE
MTAADRAGLCHTAAMPTLVYLVRHGATALSAEDRFSGSSDPPLSAEGLAQARAVANRLKGEKIAAVYCSPMQRAVQMAAAIATPHRLKPVPIDGLREIDHGHWEGLPQKDVLKRFAKEHKMWSDDPVNFAPEGGETGLSVLNRSLPALRDIVLKHANQTVAVVSHKATIRLLACALLGIDPRRYRDRLALELANIGLMSFESFDRPRMLLWNEQAHGAA